MKRRLAGFVICAFVAMGMGANCQPAGLPLPDGGDGDGTGGFTQKLILKSLEAGSTLKRVWVAVDGVPYTRETFQYTGSSLSTTEHTSEFQFTAQAGQWVTLVAFDSVESFSAGVTQFSHTDKPDFPDANEFVRWDGDLDTADMTNFGEVAYQADRDRTITAVFQRMPTFIVRSRVNNTEQTGPGITAQLQISDYLTFPGQGGPKVLNYGFSVGWLDVQQVGAARSGSVLTLTPNPPNLQPNPNYVFNGWAGTCGGGTCVLDAAPPDADTTSIWTLP